MVCDLMSAAPEVHVWALRARACVRNSAFAFLSSFERRGKRKASASARFILPNWSTCECSSKTIVEHPRWCHAQPPNRLHLENAF